MKLPPPGRYTAVLKDVTVGEGNFTGAPYIRLTLELLSRSEPNIKPPSTETEDDDRSPLSVTAYIIGAMNHIIAWNRVLGQIFNVKVHHAFVGDLIRLEVRIVP